MGNNKVLLFTVTNLVFANKSTPEFDIRAMRQTFHWITGIIITITKLSNLIGSQLP